MSTAPKSPPATSSGAAPAGGPFKAEPLRRSAEMPAAPPRRGGSGDSTATPSATIEPRKLLVGRDAWLSGEIAACDLILVDGTVEARVRDSRQLEVTEFGTFKGTADIEDADIAGRFEGEMTVHGRLRVRASGRIQGTVHYAELEVDAGGQLIGDIHHKASPATPPAPRPEEAAKE